MPIKLRSLLVTLVFLVAAGSRPASAQFFVTNTNNSGAGSLRQAILDANTAPGTNTVGFAIGTGARTIQLNTALPDVTGPITINGNTQPGYNGTPLIEIIAVAGAEGTFSALTVRAGSSTVRAVVMNRFGSAIDLFSDNNVVEGCYIGTDLSGAAYRGNLYYGVYSNGSFNRIGGDTPAERNVLSGNGYSGIGLGTFASTTGIPPNGNRVLGNYIGTNAVGTAASLNNSTGGGVILGSATNTVISGNVISGNNGGIEIDDSRSTGNVVQNNLIGTDVTGRVAVPNSSGVLLRFGASGNTVGGFGTNQKNVISGNTSTGVFIGEAANNAVQNNLIGTDVTGTANLGNGAWGVILGSEGGKGAVNNTIDGNVVSGNSLAGAFGNVGISGNTLVGNVIQNNLIGTDVTGQVALPGNRVGVSVQNGASANTVIGNVVGGNLLRGVALFNNANNNVVTGNWIGTDRTGTAPLGNGREGVIITRSSGNVISTNVIAFSGLTGVSVGTQSVSDTGVVTTGPADGNRISANSLYANGDLGIDLGGVRSNAGPGGDGVTPNDLLDADNGANGLQNYPVLTIAANDGSRTIVSGTLSSTPNATFAVEFFTSDAADPSGFGEGQRYLGSLNMVTDANGIAPFTFTSSAVGVGGFVTATATAAASSDTSEFSNAARVIRSAQDVTAQVSVTRGGFRYNRVTGHFFQQVTLQNTGTSAIAGPVSLVLDTLSATATLVNRSGITTMAAPLGSPYINLSNGLAAGETATLVLEFTSTGNAPIIYTTRVLAGPGSR